MATIDSLQIGDSVKLYNTDFPDGNPTGVIIAIQDEAENPGKIIGVRMDNSHPRAHSCDGLCDDGFGFWSRPEYLALL